MSAGFIIPATSTPATSRTPCQTARCRRSNAFAYTFDMLIPIGAFGLRSAYASTGPAQWLAYALIAAGWILATAVIAGITRTIRRD